MTTRTSILNTIGLGLVLGLATGPARGQTSLWQDAADGHWAVGANWSAGVPGEDMHAVVTNATGSYTVTYDTTDTAFKNSTVDDNTRLYIGNAGEGETVTLNVSADMIRDEAPTTDDFRLYMTDGAVINVTNATLAAQAGADTKGTLNILDGGTVRWRTLTGNSGMQPIVNVQSGGEFRLYPANNFTIGRGAVITVEAGGLMRHTDGIRDFLFTPQGTGSGGQLIVRGEYRGDTVIRLGFQASTTWPEIRVEGNGVFTQSGTSRVLFISNGDGANNTTGRFVLTGNGVVTNRATLRIGLTTATTTALISRGELLIYGGYWFNDSPSFMLIGGQEPNRNSDFSGLPAGAYTTNEGTLLQTSGVFRTRADTIYLANGPSHGYLTLEGGDFIATNATATTTLHVGSQFFVQASMPPPGTGTLHVAGGNLTVNRLLAVHDGFSRIDFESGTLTVDELVVTNGLPLVVGDGAQAATLNLRGGTHSLDDGLTINANATLSVGGTHVIQSAAMAGDLVLEDNARLAWAFEDGDQDALTVTGTVTLPNAVEVELNSLDDTTPPIIPLISATGGFSGSPVHWPAVELNGRTYQAVVEGNSLQMQFPRGTMILVR